MLPGYVLRCFSGPQFLSILVKIDRKEVLMYVPKSMEDKILPGDRIEVEKEGNHYYIKEEKPKGLFQPTFVEITE